MFACIIMSSVVYQSFIRLSHLMQVLVTSLFEECIFAAGLVRPLNPNMHNPKMLSWSYNMQKCMYTSCLICTQYEDSMRTHKSA